MPTRYHLGTAVPATADAAGIMAALATVLATATDVDTGASTAGGILTWTRDTTAGSQAIYSNAFGPRNSRIILAVHDSGTPSPSPTMLSLGGDSYTAANLFIGLCDNAAGNYIAWQNAGPFYQSGGSGSVCTFAGYSRFSVSSGSTAGEMRVWSSLYDVWIQARVSTTSVLTAHYGAIVQGVTGFQESDGYRYGGMVSGISDMISTWRSSTSTGAGAFGKHANTNGAPHAFVYTVGATTTRAIRMAHIRYATANSATAKWESAGPTFARGGVQLEYDAAPTNTVGGWLGVADGTSTQTASIVNSAAATLWGWALSSTVSGLEDSIVIAKTY